MAVELRHGPVLRSFSEGGLTPFFAEAAMQGRQIYTVLTGHKPRPTDCRGRKAQKKFFSVSSVNSVANKYEASVAIVK